MRVCVCRYIFLFDKVVIVCKRKGYSYELKEIIELQSYKMSDDLMNNRDMKKVRRHGGGGDRATPLHCPARLSE